MTAVRLAHTKPELFPVDGVYAPDVRRQAVQRKRPAKSC